MKKPYWYKLIKGLIAKGDITDGLTIPYLFGAYAVIEQPFKSIDQLINHILNSPTDIYPVIQKCDRIEHQVIILEDKKVCNKTYKTDVKFESAKKDNILYISSNTSLGKTIEQVCQSLKVEYDNPIQREEFSWSKTKKKWRKFEPEEIQFIKSI